MERAATVVIGTVAFLLPLAPLWLPFFQEACR